MAAVAAQCRDTGGPGEGGLAWGEALMSSGNTAGARHSEDAGGNALTLDPWGWQSGESSEQETGSTVPTEDEAKAVKPIRPWVGVLL